MDIQLKSCVNGTLLIRLDAAFQASMDTLWLPATSQTLLDTPLIPEPLHILVGLNLIPNELRVVLHEVLDDDVLGFLSVKTLEGHLQ